MSRRASRRCSARSSRTCAGGLVSSAPALFTGAIAILLPVFVAVLVPAVTGERLSDSADLQIALELYRQQPWTRVLDAEAAIQALHLPAVPRAAGAVAGGGVDVAAPPYSVIGEKQARTLEPLLATPITTFELLLREDPRRVPAGARRCRSPASRSTWRSRRLFARARRVPGPADTAALGVLFLLGPMASLTALHAGRVRVVAGQRRAQRPAAGVLVVLPITGLLDRADHGGGFVLTRAGHPAASPRVLAVVERRPDAARRGALRS